VACYEGHIATALMLIEHGASLTEKTNIGNTPLHVACEKGVLEVVELLLSSGADIKAKDNVSYKY
jgi:ankyrin repeat protein